MMVENCRVDDCQKRPLTYEIERLRAALQNLVDNVLDYEKINNLSPSYGRKYCWDTVEQAVAILEYR